jgi:hypothetical protein
MSERKTSIEDLIKDQLQHGVFRSGGTDGADTRDSRSGGTGGTDASHTVRILPSIRTVEPYSIFETELISISSNNNQASIFFTFAGGCAGGLVTLGKEFFSYTENERKPLDWQPAVMFLLVFLIFICVSIALCVKRNVDTIINQIKKESKE